MRKADIDRFQRLVEIGCIACRQMGRYAVPDVHHALHAGRRMGHQHTIPLCPAHHRGVGHVESIHGPSLAKTPKAFRERFGTDEQLLSTTNELLGELWTRTAGISSPPF